MRIALSTPTGYLTAEKGGEAEPERGLVTANRQHIGAWETWTPEPQPDGTVAFKSCNGFYLSAEGGGGSVVYANREKVGSWETFTASGPIADAWALHFKTADGQHYLSVSAVGDHVVDAVGTRTYFTVEVIDADPVTLPRLVRIDRDRHRMVDEHGTLVYGRGASAFLLYKRFLDGDDITPQLRQLQELGCNLIRVMGTFESLGGFNPKAYADYYTRMGSFFALCAGFGIYVLFTACAATGSVFTEDEAYEHIRHCRDECLKASTLFSPVNEQGQHNNNIPRDRVCRELVNAGTMGTTLYDTGSFGMDIPCSPPYGTHAVLHTARRSQTQEIKDCNTADHPNYVNDGLEVGLDEPLRIGTTDDPNGEGNPKIAQDAAGAAYQALFWVAHSLQGEKGDVLTGNTLDCVTAAFRGMKGHQ